VAEQLQRKNINFNIMKTEEDLRKSKISILIAEITDERTQHTRIGLYSNPHSRAKLEDVIITSVLCYHKKSPYSTKGEYLDEIEGILKENYVFNVEEHMTDICMQFDILDRYIQNYSTKINF
jgi:hypothetical protein